MPYFFQRRRKYNAHRCQSTVKELLGVWFDSLLERSRAEHLVTLQRGGVISGIMCHPKVTLVNIITWKLDFVYIQDGRTIFEDVKGFETEAFKLKLKIWRAVKPDAVLRIVKGRPGRWIVTDYVGANA